MLNCVTLEFEKTITRVAGFDYGQECYRNQILGKLDYTQPFTLIIPSHIQRIASSFVQGFFADIKKEIGISGIRENMTISSPNEKLKSDIVEKLYGN